jgi:hypothetical protein
MQTGTASSFRSVLMFGDTDQAGLFLDASECRIHVELRQDRNCSIELAEIPSNGFLR